MKPSLPFFYGVLFVSLSLLLQDVNAQFFDRLNNPQIIANLVHPPGFGFKVNKIVFSPASGECSDQIVEGLTSDFVSNNVEVIDRANLNMILQEHSFTLSGYVDKTSAAELGKILGPSVLVVVKVNRCVTVQEKLYDKETKYDAQRKVNYEVYAYYSRTKAFLNVSVKTVDLATARIFSAQSFEYTPEKSNKAYEGYPAFPADFEVKDIAIKKAVGDIHKMYLPWNEIKTLYFFDDKEYNLKEAFSALKENNIDKAFELSKKNLEQCKNDDKAKDKKVSHAAYNLGICYMLRNDYTSAINYFSEAKELKSGSIVTDAIGDCQRAKQLQESMQRIEDKATFEASQSQAVEQKNTQTEAANTLTNKSIIDMMQLKLPESIIIQKIKTSKCKFDTTPDGLASLTKSGVSEKIMMAMIEKQ